MATSGERIKNHGSANSSSWSTKEEEKAGRASMHESQKRGAAIAKERQDEQNNLDQEVVEADRTAGLSRKRKQEQEVHALLQAQQEDQDRAGSVALPGIFAAKARAAQEPKQSRLPSFVAVKRQRLTTTAASADQEVEGSDPVNARDTAEGKSAEAVVVVAVTAVAAAAAVAVATAALPAPSVDGGSADASGGGGASLGLLGGYSSSESDGDA
mmetsp:Transcript_23895/g.67693  ORF Transcript_23895/g.67693 Transcript_23895/m.67693 type:complete len:213 (-) Transcript_23895:239-877(-)|eukprot:CAMPEP_0177156964 /NCGR_PEP_ID=MMETSP0367-20130122/3005_1 /TAXON_ID=447022 ORGANISM="Scrippsiella hangoei-like, Strain SHHI-4" /NCGR_SAMPLE_ID=MMETSP0367 /ASSEMBLY_ACC=CAM_ASM_000362 /LENGTH=212 /DNA_ID=CAMNT_0018602449 /DNA_START=1 /DNA_END=639 /DNA_ORIENTATION=-